MANMTLARALRERKTLIGKISESRQRASSSAVVDDGMEPDFNVDDQIVLHAERQADLRSLKVAIAEASAKARVKIPEDAPVVEAGQEVGVNHAVLIRDDLKGQRSLLGELVSTPLKETSRYGLGDEDKKPKIRKFSFQIALDGMDALQEHIDAIDSAIQYVNNNWKVDI